MGIPLDRICEGITLCYCNAQRLVEAARYYMKGKYETGGAIDPRLLQEVTYGSCSGLAVLAIEEIGKGFFLFEKYQKRDEVTDSEWKQHSRAQSAHLKKIEKVQELLGSETPEMTEQMNDIKKRDIYVDWIDGNWRSPFDLDTKNQQVTNIICLAEKGLTKFADLLVRNGIATDFSLLKHKLTSG